MGVECPRHDAGRCGNGGGGGGGGGGRVRRGGVMGVECQRPRHDAGWRNGGGGGGGGGRYGSHVVMGVECPRYDAGRCGGGGVASKDELEVALRMLWECGGKRF